MVIPLLPLLIGLSTAMGVRYFCVDVYRNRRRLSERPVPEANLTCYELEISDHVDCQTIGQTVNHTGPAIGEATSECISGSVGHCVEAIAHVFSHHY